MADLNLNAISYFEAVARLGGVTPAAEELGISPSAVSQQIRGLETALGVRLFKREKRRVFLTIDGERLFQTTHEALEAIRKVRSAIVQRRETYVLSIRVSPSFGAKWLAPRLSSFSRSHPDWKLRVDATPNFSEFTTEKIDLDLRYGAGIWAGLHSDCVVRDMVLPMCSPAYLAELQAVHPAPAGQLRQAKLIDSVKSYCRWNQWLELNHMPLPSADYSYRFDRSSMSVQMAKDGAGIILESTTLAFDELKSGELVPWSNQFPVIEFPAYWLVCPPRHLNLRAVREFGAWVHEAAGRTADEQREFLTSAGFRTLQLDAHALAASRPLDE